MKKIGIMGGTFNPIHNGHLLLAERAYEAYALDQIIFMPTRQPAYKVDTEIASEEIRADMIRMSIANKSYFYISTLEYEREGNTYTIDTMEMLLEKYRDCIFYFIIGADSLFQLEHWHRAADLMKITHFLVATRNYESIESMKAQAEKLRQKYGANIAFIPFPTMEISSSNIRKRCKEQLSISYLVPENVEAYIKERKLYM